MWLIRKDPKYLLGIFFFRLKCAEQKEVGPYIHGAKKINKHKKRDGGERLTMSNTAKKPDFQTRKNKYFHKEMLKPPLELL